MHSVDAMLVLLIVLGHIVWGALLLALWLGACRKWGDFR